METQQPINTQAIELTKEMELIVGPSVREFRTANAAANAAHNALEATVGMIARTMGVDLKEYRFDIHAMRFTHRSLIPEDAGQG